MTDFMKPDTKVKAGLALGAASIIFASMAWRITAILCFIIGLALTAEGNNPGEKWEVW